MFQHIRRIIAAREGDYEGALGHLEAAQEDINTVVSSAVSSAYCLDVELMHCPQAEALDCTFIQLCGRFCCLSRV